MPRSDTSFAVRATDAAGNAGATFAQTFTRNAPPTVANPISDQTFSVAAGDQTTDLANVFADAEQVVRLSVQYPDSQTGVTQTGFIDINLFNQTPATVQNFLTYVNSHSYDGTIFHRLAPGFVLQGGGFTFNASGTDTATTFPAITANGPVINEPVFPRSARLRWPNRPTTPTAGPTNSSSTSATTPATWTTRTAALRSSGK